MRGRGALSRDSGEKSKRQKKKERDRRRLCGREETHFSPPTVLASQKQKRRAKMRDEDTPIRPSSSRSRLANSIRRSRSMQRLASDGEHASRLVLFSSLVVGITLGSLLPRDIPGADGYFFRSDLVTRGNQNVFSRDLALSERRKRAREGVGHAMRFRGFLASPCRPRRSHRRRLFGVFTPSASQLSPPTHPAKKLRHQKQQ